MFRKILTTAAVAAVLAAAPAMASAASHPSITAPISHTMVVTSNGEAGYYAFSGTHFKRVQGRFTTTLAAEGLGSGGGEGIQLCNASSGRADQLGVRWDAGENAYDVLYDTGTLASTGGTDTSACTSGGAFSGTPIGLEIPAGDTVALSITDEGHGLAEFRAEDTTIDTSIVKAFAHGTSFPDVASAGVVQNEAGLSAPAASPLVTFRDVRVTLPSGKSGTLGRGHTRWTAVQAYSTANGTPSDPALVSPAGSLDAGHFTISIGAETGV
jgi:hypothetical protein